jgi:hypothetical protein
MIALQAQTLAPATVPEDAPTLESLAEERKSRMAKEEAQQLDASTTQTQSEDGSPSPLDPAQAEDESGQAGAFNPETGEINWDCPCLGGMAHGPCGENFKEAFSCFVFSKEEPKGMDCIDKFKWVGLWFERNPLMSITEACKIALESTRMYTETNWSLMMKKVKQRRTLSVDSRPRRKGKPRWKGKPRGNLRP